MLTLCLLLAADWPALRGADGHGISPTAAATQWAVDRGVRFSTPIPGRGDSSPVVAGRWIHVTTQDSRNRLLVVTIDRLSGRVHRQTAVGQGTLSATGPRSLWADRHNAATPTPVATADRVWAFFGTGLLVCLDAESHAVQWQTDLAKTYGEYDITFGMGASPRQAIRGGQPVLLVSAITKGASYVLCLDAATGREVWKTDRRYTVDRDAADAYATPVVRQAKQGPEVVVVGADRVDAYDLAGGKRRWVADGLGIDSPYGRIIATPAIGRGRLDGLVIACSANPSGGGLGRTIGVAVDSGRGSAVRLWQSVRASPDSCSPLLVRDRAVLLSGQGVMTVLDPTSGSRQHIERLPGEYFASPVATVAEDQVTVYLLATDGRCSVVGWDAAALPLADPELIDVNSLPGTFYATPAIADGVLYLRAWDRLYAIGG